MKKKDLLRRIDELTDELDACEISVRPVGRPEGTALTSRDMDMIRVGMIGGLLEADLMARMDPDDMPEVRDQATHMLADAFSIVARYDLEEAMAHE